MRPYFREAIMTNRSAEMVACVNECNQVLTMEFSGKLTNDSFFQALSYCRYRNCSEPKDRVYGLLGLAPTSIAMMIRYDYTLQEIYEIFAATMIQSTENLDLLTHATLQTGQKSDVGWPSWVPDWRCKSDTGNYRATSCHADGRNVVYSISGERVFQLRAKHNQ